MIGLEFKSVISQMHPASLQEPSTITSTHSTYNRGFTTTNLILYNEGTCSNGIKPLADEINHTTAIINYTYVPTRKCQEHVEKESLPLG